VRDLMIQNVCLDASGALLPGRSPADGAPECVAQRDLRPGEHLPYHKHDHPSPDQAAGAPLGYQRHDSYPVETADAGVVVEHSFDFGAGEGRRFGRFDSGSDGGDVAMLSDGAASLGATEDGGTGFMLWTGECRDLPTPASLARSWLILEFDPARSAPLEGRTVVRLGGAPGGRRTCPGRYASAFTSWRMAPFRYRAAPGQGKPVTLDTLVSDHYGGADPDTADHVERFYFTRELGGTRWERWQNVRGNKQVSAAWVAEQGARFAESGRCSPAEPPPGARMVLIDCREWTRIVPPTDPAGDPPGFWLEAVRTRPDAPDFFAAPGSAHK
jgi:hypothetical protein